MKKIFSIILSVIIFLNVFALTVNATEYTGKCGDNLTWTLDTATGTLTISGEGAMNNYAQPHNVGVHSPWWTYMDYIRNVVIESGITTVGEHSFCDHDELRAVNIKNGSIIIEKKAFWGCNKLTSVTIGDNTQSGSGGIIREHAFEYSNLSTVIIGNGMEIIEQSAFSSCDDLINITLPKSVREFSYSYIWLRPTINYCGTSAEWDVFLNNNYTNSYLLNQCPVICQDETIYPHGWCGENLAWEIDLSTNSLIISGIGAMWDYYDFADNESPWYRSRPWFREIDKIIINDGVETIGNYAFYCCSEVENIIIPDSVTTIGEGAFQNCSNLAEVTIPDSVTTIGEGAFQNCSNLAEVTIPDSVTTIGGGAFQNCSNLAEVTIPDSVTTIGEATFQNCSNLTEITIPDSVTTIGDRAFYSCSNLRTVSIGEGTKIIGEWSFCLCENLENVTIRESTTIIKQGAFSSCEKLSDIYYTGSEEQWSEISIGKWSDWLKSATIHYNYCRYSYVVEEVFPTCTTHGYTKYECEYCRRTYVDYTANPTGHTLNEDGVCTVCGEREISTNHINTQKLTIESVFAMVMNLLAKIFGVFSVV